MPSDAYQRTTWGGVTLNRRTAAMMEAAIELMGEPPTAVYQGSYSTDVAASSTTHAGGGAIDCWHPDHQRFVLCMRRVGFAAYFRPELWRDGERIWGNHIHAIAIGDTTMSPAAAEQVVDYYLGRNGLADHGPDTDPRIVPIPVFDYDEWKEAHEMQDKDFKRIEQIVEKEVAPLRKALAAFRQNEVARDKQTAAQLGQLDTISSQLDDLGALVDELPDAATKPEIHRMIQSLRRALAAPDDDTTTTKG